MFRIDVQNVGGIREGQATLERGINTVQADNWQGKSSFITAIRTAMGTTGMGETTHPLTEGRNEGQVVLETEDQTYEATLTRDGQTVTRDGNTYLTEQEAWVRARLFAFLGEENPVRAAVRNGNDLADLLGQPLDLENIDERIESLQTERRDVERDLEQAKRDAERLPRVQEDVTRLEQKLEELREEYDDLEAERDDREDQANLRDELSAKRATLNQVQGDLDRLENTIERKESRLADKQDELEALDLPASPEADADIDEKQTRIAELGTQIEILEDVHSANKRILDENQFHVLTDVERSLSGDELSCWTCGGASTVDEFEAKLDDLRARIRDRRSERETLESEVDTIRRQREKLEQKRRTKRNVETEIGELETSLEEARRDRERREEQVEELNEEIADLQDTVEETDDRLTDLQSDIKVTEQKLAQKTDELEELEDRNADVANLEERYDELGDEIAEIRDRKKNKQREIAAQFEEAMEDIIAEFEPGFESARLEPRTNRADEIVDFDLIVAREGREAQLDALSEGELEILGIVTALAGYRTFDVADHVPMILLDNVGGLSGRRIESLVEYLHEEADYLVTTAYPESGDFQGHTISPDEWDVVSDRETVTS